MNEQNTGQASPAGGGLKDKAALGKLSFDNTQVAFSPKSDAELFRAYILFSTMNKPWLVGMGTKMIRAGLSMKLPIKGLIKPTLFGQFCGGESIEDCEPTIQKLEGYGVGTILDYSVEGASSEKGFEETAEELLATIRKSKGREGIPFCVFKVTGIAPTPVLEKVHAGAGLTGEEANAWNRVQERVDQLCRTAYDQDVRIFIDAEESWIQDTIDELAERMMRQYNQEKAIVYNTYQLYLKSKLPQLKADYEKALEEGYFLGAKLVRGAYMEKERERARVKGYESPVQPDKEATDRDFNAAMEFCLPRHERIAVCAGTHNEESSLLLARLMEEAGIPQDSPSFFFAQLYGMSDHISYNLANAGYNVAKYVPYGPVASVMPYLFRRADENTSISGQSSREFRLIEEEVKRRKFRG